MRTKKQVFLYFDNPDKYREAVDMLLALNVKFNGWKQKYIRVSQKTFREHPVDLYTECTNLFSSVI